MNSRFRIFQRSDVAYQDYAESPFRDQATRQKLSVRFRKARADQPLILIATASACKLNEPRTPLVDSLLRPRQSKSSPVVQTETIELRYQTGEFLNA